VFWLRSRASTLNQTNEYKQGHKTTRRKKGKRRKGKKKEDGEEGGMRKMNSLSTIQIKRTPLDLRELWIFQEEKKK
jgi:hypothetical protein